MTPGRLGAGGTLLVVAFAASILLPGLGGSCRVLTKHEVLVAEPARRMLEGGPWIVPEFAGEARTRKPPTMSWLVALSFAAFGTNEWAARLPSALSGVALAWIVSVIAARWFGRRVGVWAGLLQATTGGQLIQARLAEADMPLAAAVAAALLCFAMTRLEPCAPGRGYARAFAVAAGCSFLLKGVGPLLILLAILAFAIWERRRDAVTFLLDPVAVAIFLAAVLAWPLAALAREPGILDTWRRETLGRALGEMGDKGTPFLYLATVPLLLLPWLPYGIAGAAHVRGERLRFLVSWAVPGLLLLTVIPFRSPHYAIPMLAPFTVLAAVGFDRALEGPRRIWLLWLLLGGASGAVLVAARRLAPLFVPASAVIGLVTLGLAVALLARRPNRKALLLFGTLWAGVLASSFLIVPRLDDYRDWTDLARRTNAARGQGEPVSLLRLGESQVVFYLDRPVRRFDPEAPRPLLVLARSGERAWLEALGTVETVERASTLRRGETEADRLTLFRLR